jgi:hypothetical protein
MVIAGPDLLTIDTARDHSEPGGRTHMPDQPGGAAFRFGSRSSVIDSPAFSRQAMKFG